MSTFLNTTEFLQRAIEQKASDVFIVVGLPASMRINNTMVQDSDKKLLPQDTEEIITEFYRLSGNRSMEKLRETGDDDFSFAIPGLSRFRVSAYKQRGTLSAVVRIITFSLPKPSDLGIPDNIIDLDHFSNGMVLLTGPAVFLKSTTLACMIDHINQNLKKHIITLEDPLEYLHRHNQSIVSQREVNVDTENYVTALRAALRQSPDVILLGEMRDYETIQVAMTAAETGHLILSTLHTLGCANTIDRIIDVFPPSQQHQIAVQLSMVLKAVVSQQLVPDIDGKLIPAFEIMTISSSIRSMIRDENTRPQIDGVLYSYANDKMMSMDNSLAKLFKDGRITRETALTYATNPSMLEKKIQ